MLATDAVDPGLDLQTNFLAWPQTCLIPTNLPDDLHSWLILAAISRFALLGYQGTGLPVLPHPAPGSHPLRSSHPSLLPCTDNQNVCPLAGNQKSLSHAFQFILNTKYANWRWSPAHANSSLHPAGLCSTWCHRESSLIYSSSSISNSKIMIMFLWCKFLCY